MPSISMWSTIFGCLTVAGALCVLIGAAGSFYTGNVIKLETKENQDIVVQIKGLIDKVKNGSRSAYENLDKINEIYPNLTEEQYEPVENAHFSFRRIFENHVRVKFNTRLIDLETKKTKKWSLEYLYSVFKFSNRIGNDEDTRIAAINEAGRIKSEYLIQELYCVAVNDENIFVGISAAQAICKITDYAPYRTRKRYPYRQPEKNFINDIPEFVRLKKWWKEKGSQQLKYMCPFDELISSNRNYLYYGRSHHESTDFMTFEQRLHYLKEILIKYPKLSRSRAEMAYLLLGDKATFPEVANNALQSLNESDSEPLPALLLAYISFVTKDNENCKKWLSKAIENSNEKSVLTCLQINDKFQILFYPLFSLLKKK